MHIQTLTRSKSPDHTATIDLYTSGLVPNLRSTLQNLKKQHLSILDPNYSGTTHASSHYLVMLIPNTYSIVYSALRLE